MTELNQKWKVGDLVRLKSGGPRMTVLTVRYKEDGPAMLRQALTPQSFTQRIREETEDVRAFVEQTDKFASLLWSLWLANNPALLTTVEDLPADVTDRVRRAMSKLSRKKEVVCQWFDSADRLQKGVFLPELLEKATD